MRLRLALLAIGCTLGVAAACSSTNEVVDGGGQDATPDNALPDSANETAADAACHDVVNAAPIVHASMVNAPFPTGLGVGGDFTSGKYFLTSVVYYYDSTDAGDADADAGDGAVSSPYWQTTIDLQVTVGSNANRTWHIGKLPDLSDTIEHREVLVFDTVNATSISMHSWCSDLPVTLTAEYTSTPTEFTLWIGPAHRVETYTRQ